jgi:hypothetical protein
MAEYMEPSLVGQLDCERVRQARHIGLSEKQTIIVPLLSWLTYTKTMLNFGPDESSHHVEAVSVVEDGEFGSVRSREAKIPEVVNAAYCCLIRCMAGNSHLRVICPC